MTVKEIIPGHKWKQNGQSFLFGTVDSTSGRTNGMRFRFGNHTIKDAIQRATNAIRVTDESASGYNTAIVELLNRFGITP